MSAIVALTCDNGSAPGGAGNTLRGLTHTDRHNRSEGYMKPTQDLGDTDFWDRVMQDGDCWTWIGSKTPTGYGTFHFQGRISGAHRFAYEHLVTSIPDGLEIDHLCRNRACVNPEHLDPVTHSVNLSRRDRTGGSHHCGFTIHPRTPANIRVKKAIGAEVCLTCERERATAKVTCPTCGRLSSVGNLARHQTSYACTAASKESQDDH